MKDQKKGYKFRIGSMVFVVEEYNKTMKKYQCRLWNTDKIYYFTAQQIFRR